MKRVKARKDAIVAQSRTAIAHWMEGLANATVYRGQARFTAPKTVAVGGQLLTADKNWPDWYAEYMVREQNGKELPQ